MRFTFNFGDQGPLLFSFWVLDTPTQFLMSCVVIGSLSYFSEVLSEHRARLHVPHANGGTGAHVHWKTLLYVAHLALSTVLMLIAMTMNVWIIGSVLLGAGLGFLQHAQVRLTQRDDASHCGTSATSSSSSLVEQRRVTRNGADDSEDDLGQRV
jgi:hypothetical protein